MPGLAIVSQYKSYVLPKVLTNEVKGRHRLSLARQHSNLEVRRARYGNQTILIHCWHRYVVLARLLHSSVTPHEGCLERSKHEQCNMFIDLGTHYFPKLWVSVLLAPWHSRAGKGISLIVVR